VLRHILLSIVGGDTILNRLYFSVGLALAVAALLSVRAQSPKPTSQGQLVSSQNESGARTFSTNCSGCHGADGHGGERAPNIATARNIVALSDEDLIAIVKKGMPGTGMPSFAFLGDQGVKDVVSHLRHLQGKTSAVQITGDPAAGRTLFFGQAECSQCHMVKGEGGYIAADLTDYANGIPHETVERVITKPDATLASSSTMVELRLRNGELITGVARAEDNFNITVQTKDGRWHTFDKTKLADLKHTDHSLHPRDYGTRLSAKELDDLVSYLVVSAANTPEKPSRRRNH
jgi:putative heme-binding domain-containing protein